MHLQIKSQHSYITNPKVQFFFRWVSLNSTSWFIKTRKTQKDSIFKDNITTPGSKFKKIALKSYYIQKENENA